MTESDNTHSIEDYHAHLYFDADTVERARVICEQARDRFGVVMGRVHERDVGPHPRWSCQLTVSQAQFAAVIPWLSLHRDGLTVFIHPNTGDAFADHTEHAIWMGELLPLNLGIFSPGGSA